MELTMNKRGQAVSDLAVFLVILFCIALLAFIVVKMFGGVNTQFQSSSSGLSVEAASASQDSYDGLAKGFDSAMIVALGLMYFGLFITARNIGTEPLWFVLNVFLIMTALVLAAILGNALEQGFNTTDFLLERAAMPGLVFVGAHWLGFAIGAAAMILIGLFAKPE